MPQAKEKIEGRFLKVPPHNLEAEQAILGGVLLNNDAMNMVTDILKPDDFYREAHASVFHGMVDLYNQTEPIDIITLSQRLISKALLEKVGGTDYLASLVESVSTSAGIVHHAQIVKSLAVKRRLINSCSMISESCFKDTGDTEEILEIAEQAIYDIAEEQVKEGFQSIKEVIKGASKGWSACLSLKDM